MNQLANLGFWWEAMIVNLPIALFCLWCGKRAARLVR